MTNVFLLSKVIAALTAILPLYLSKAEAERLLPSNMKHLLQEPAVIAVIIFGTSFAACGDVKATVLAGLLLLFAAAYVAEQHSTGDGGVSEKDDDDAFPASTELPLPSSTVASRGRQRVVVSGVHRSPFNHLSVDPLDDSGVDDS